MAASPARTRSNRKHAARRRAANKAAREECRAAVTEADDYYSDSSFIIAADIYDNHLSADTRQRVQDSVVDHEKHSLDPRVVTVRLLIVSLIALSLQGKDPHLRRIAASLCSHRKTKSRRVRQLRQKTRVKHLRVPKNQYVSYAMVQHTFARLEEHLSADMDVTGPDGEPVTDTLLNWLGVDLPQASIAASGDAGLYASSSTVATDTSTIEAFVDHTPKIDKKTGEILKSGYDPDARRNHKTGTRRKRGGEIISYQYENVVAVRDLAPNRIKHSINKEPFPGTATAARFHNENHNAEQVAEIFRLLTARGHHIHTAIADRGFSKSLSAKWSAALRSISTGIEPVHDLTKIQRGHRPYIHTVTTNNDGQPISSLDSLDGTLFENNVVAHLEALRLTDLEKTEWVVKAKSRDDRNGNTKAQDARLANITKFDNRDAYSWKAHDRIGPWSGRYRGPAHHLNPSAWCINWPRSHRRQKDLPKTPCTPDQQCNCGRLITVTLDPDNKTHEEFNKIRQQRHYGTTGWHSLYEGGRSLAESNFSGMRGNFTNHAQPLTTRVSGTNKRGLVKLCMTVAENVKLIASHRRKRGLEPNPEIEPTNTPPPDPATGPQTDSPPPSGTDPPKGHASPPDTP